MAHTIANDAKPWSALRGKLHDGLLQGLAAMNYDHMTPVQQKVIYDLPSYRADCLVQAKTGTGKTIAFALPALQSLLTDPPLQKGQIAILIVSPTRELALQIAAEIARVTACIQPTIECHTAYGGTSKERDLKKFLNGNPRVLVATPGRLNDYLNDDFIAEKFSNVRTVVLDEADQMLDAGFLPAINDILRRLPPKHQGWQGMCFSATIPDKVVPVLGKVLAPNHVRITTVDADDTPTIDKVTQHSIVVPALGDIFPTLLALLQNEFRHTTESFKAIVFGSTANGVALMNSLFSVVCQQNQSLRDLEVFQLQSRLTQKAREKTTDAFKSARAGILFASDVIGRGMDFPNVSHVIQVGLPSSSDQYVHRVGRTARAGNEGRAITLLTDREAFFIHTNRFLPISPYPADLSPIASQSQQSIDYALASVDDKTKAKAYQAWLGFNKTFMKKLRYTPEELVRAANEYAATMGCPEPPIIEKSTVGKMGLKGVKGLNIGMSPFRDGNTPGRGQQQSQRDVPRPVTGEPGPQSQGGGRRHHNGAPRRGGRGGRGGQGNGRVSKP